MYLWSTNLCVLLGTVTWCLHCYSFFHPGKWQDCTWNDYSYPHTFQFIIHWSFYHSMLYSLGYWSVGKWTINTDKKLPHTNFFENESNKVLLTIQLCHNCSNALHEIKINRCFKDCWGVYTCMQTHTHTLSK
jgi:hypothetical protein